VRAVRSTSLALLLSAALAVFSATGCGSDDGTNNAWCKVAKQKHSAFESDNVADKGAIAQFAKIEAQAPPEVRDDLRLVREGGLAFLRSDPAFSNDPQRTQAAVDARKRVDQYLEDECGIDIPTRGE
jgi:hypothetical protein